MALTSDQINMLKAIRDGGASFDPVKHFGQGKVFDLCSLGLIEAWMGKYRVTAKGLDELLRAGG